VYIDKKRSHVRNVLIGYKKKETRNDEENNEEDVIKNAVSIVIQNQS
jgi:hypothetical protein